MIFQSQLLKSFPQIVHGFTGRQLGSDQTKIFSELGRTDLSLVTLNQIHSSQVRVVASLPSIQEEGDALMAGKSGLCVAVRTADCVPILLFDPVSNLVSAVHAGWRGLIGGVIENTLLVMCDRAQSKMSDIIVAIGPALCESCFEVGPEVVDEFVKKYGPGFKAKSGKGDRSYIALRSMCVTTLVSQNILPENIELITGCTSCHNDQFFSYRRGDKEGRQLSFIGFT